MKSQLWKPVKHHHLEAVEMFICAIVEQGFQQDFERRSIGGVWLVKCP